MTPYNSPYMVSLVYGLKVRASIAKYEILLSFEATNFIASF